MSLPDYLKEGLRVVICGTAPGLVSAERGHYYSGPGNEFWGTLYEARIIPEPLGSSRDSRVLEFGVGLTDIARKGVAASSDRGLGSQYDVSGFIRKMEMFAPAWVAFHGKAAAQVVSKAVPGANRVALGEQAWKIGESKVFVLPSMSGSNRDPKRLEGKSSREDWFRELAERLPPSAEGE